MLTSDDAEHFSAFIERLESATDLDFYRVDDRTDLDEILDCPCDSCRNKLLELYGVCLQSDLN